MPVQQAEAVQQLLYQVRRVSGMQLEVPLPHLLPSSSCKGHLLL